MTNDDPFVYDQYNWHMQAAINPLLGRQLTLLTLTALREAATAAQYEFLYNHPNYVPLHEVTIVVTEEGHVNVNAPILTKEEKYEYDWRQREQETRAKRMLEEQLARNLAFHKSEARMHKLHRKLFKKYADAIPPSTGRIWHSLSDGQQYAILKDIDYAHRHAGDQRPQVNSP